MPACRSSRWRLIVLLVGAALLLYPLSFGPAYWVCSDGRGALRSEERSVQAFLEFYSPLIWLYQNGPAPIRRALDRYLALWGAP